MSVSGDFYSSILLFHTLIIISDERRIYSYLEQLYNAVFAGSFDVTFMILLYSMFNCILNGNNFEDVILI